MKLLLCCLLGTLFCIRVSADETRTNILQSAATTDHVEKLAQNVDRYLPEVMRKAIDQSMERSYFTALSGARFSGDQTASRMLYEGQVFVNFDAWEPDNRYWWIDLPIRIGVRQLDHTSSPVLTPSYNPGLRFFHRGSRSLCALNSACYWSIGAHHYSNGQDGTPFLPDGTVNTRDGSFSTNYLEAAWHNVTDHPWFQWTRISWRHHFSSSWDIAQEKQYETDQLALAVRTRYFHFEHLSLQGTATVANSIAGRDYVVWNRVNPVLNVKATAADNINLTLELTTLLRQMLRWKNGVGFYLRYDYGYDYYNINFQHRINRLQIGIVSTNF